ncbi:hypothetical protein OAN33_05730, partial [Flavobacteriales bacterium]|nr:hypothetical protein [Flavobacteriales bacterium]
MENNFRNIVKGKFENLRNVDDYAELLTFIDKKESENSAAISAGELYFYCDEEKFKKRYFHFSIPKKNGKLRE